MKDNKKKVKPTEEVKKEVQTEEKGVQLTDEELSSVAAGNNTFFMDNKQSIIGFAVRPFAGNMDTENGLTSG